MYDIDHYIKGSQRKVSQRGPDVGINYGIYSQLGNWP